MNQAVILDFIRQHLIAFIILAAFGVIETTVLLLFLASFMSHFGRSFCEWVGESVIRDIETVTEGEKTTSILSKSILGPECAGPDCNDVCALCGHQKLMHKAHTHDCPLKKVNGWHSFNRFTKAKPCRECGDPITDADRSATICVPCFQKWMANRMEPQNPRRG